MCASTPAVLTACSASCVDLSSNTANCGVCGSACSAGQTCKSGMCSTPAMCDLLAAAGHPCVSAHSTVRALSSSYTGPLYQVCNGSFVPGPDSCSSGMTKDIGTVPGGYADAAAQDAFCAGGSCTISIIYDQSPNGNNLKPAPGGGPTGKVTPDNPAVATALPTKINGHAAYGILIKPGMGYRLLVGNGIAKNDDPESMYMVSSQSDLKNLCCFDYGNAEVDAHDDGNGTMETVNVSHGVVWGSGVNGGPWVMADLENGLYAGWENSDWSDISTNTPVLYDFITGVVVGDVAAKNGGKGRFAIYGGDATNGQLTTKYDGIRPVKPGYLPMQKQGSIILGTGGDNSSFGGGRFYEGVMTNGAWTVAIANAVQANIVAAGYGKM
jgi:non-reducing end alpha-L-arabinofuranosidase